MSTAIRTRLIKIGNSQGIRLPKTLIEQVGLGQDVEVEAQDGQLVIRPVRHPRAGWDAEFRAMAARGDDRLLDAETPTQWDESEWQW
jgi:antitoxin MazE